MVRPGVNSKENANFKMAESKTKIQKENKKEKKKKKMHFWPKTAKFGILKMLNVEFRINNTIL